MRLYVLCFKEVSVGGRFNRSLSQILQVAPEDKVLVYYWSIQRPFKMNESEDAPYMQFTNNAVY